MGTLDAYCASHHVTPAWVLIDTEGHELQVLQGATSLLANPRVGFVIEMHPTLWPDGEATGQAFTVLLRASGRTATPLTGQRDQTHDYGTVALAPDLAR